MKFRFLMTICFLTMLVLSWIDGKCLGESAPDVLFYTEVPGGKDIKVGAFVGGAGVDAVSEAVGKDDIVKLEMTKPGNCNGAR